MSAPTFIKAIPPQIINEQAAYGPFDLKDFMNVEAGVLSLRFKAECVGGEALPAGLICTSDGYLTGIPAKETSGDYQILLTATNEEGSTEAQFLLTIKPSLATATENKNAGYFNELKAQIWEALDHKLPLPDIAALFDRDITPLEIYYLLERWGVLTIYDAFNLDPPGVKKLLNLEGVSAHYHVYDRGSCLVATPKDLFSHERTMEDGLKTARAMAREAYQRNWTVELVGFNKMTRAAWVEIQHLGDKFGKQLEVINFNPMPSDIKIYNIESASLSMRKGME